MGRIRLLLFFRVVVTQGVYKFFLTVPWHAPRSACVHSWTSGSPKYELGADGTLKHAGRCVVPLRPTENLGFSQEIINNSGLYKLVLQLIDNRSKGQDEQIDLYLALVGEMANISHVRGRKFVVGFIKAGREYFNGSYSDKIVY